MLCFGLCCCCFFFLSDLFFAPQNSSFPVNQSGSGTALYSLTKTSRRHVEKFETTGVDYPLKVNNLNVRRLSHVLNTYVQDRSC